MKIKILIIVFIFSSFCVFSQENEKTKSTKVFHAIGYTVLADFVSSPVKIIPFSRFDENTSTYVDSHSFLKTEGINLGTFMYRFRYNIKEFSQESALSLSVNPSVCLELFVPEKLTDDVGLFVFNLPLLLNYEHGAGSTYKSSAEKGFVIGAGIEYFKAPILFVEQPDNMPITSFIIPVASAGFRYWTKNNRLAEINLKFGKGAKVKLPEIYEAETLPRSLSAYSFRLSYILFLNY